MTDVSRVLKDLYAAKSRLSPYPPDGRNILLPDERNLRAVVGALIYLIERVDAGRESEEL